MASDLFGLELVFKALGGDFKKKDDALVALAHWIAIKNGFKSIGLGDDKTVTGSEAGSELLPPGWNGEETYAIRYIRNQELFILRGIRTENTLILNLLRTSDLTVSNAAVNIEEAVKSLTGELSNIIPDYQSMAIRFKRELIEPCTKETKQEATTQTPNAPPESVERQDHSIPIRDPNVYQPPIQPLVNPLGDPMSPFNVGRADLDPFGGGGGMLYNPFAMPSRRNLPRGRIPGARYDPPGPLHPQPDGYSPDPDHLPPPGYDNIYM